MRILTKILALLMMSFSINQIMAATSNISRQPDLTPVYTEDKLAVIVPSNQPTFAIKLKSNPTTGFSWYLKSYDSNVLQPVKHVFVPPANRKLIGATGYEVWTFRVKPNGFSVPMQTTIQFVYGRPWEANGQVTPLVFQVTTQAS